MKVTVVGAGNVGATCANCIAEKDIVNEVVLLDIKEGVAEGKSLDMWQTAPINLYDTRIKGVTNDYEATNNSEVVVITSGLPRKPGILFCGCTRLPQPFEQRLHRERTMLKCPSI